MPPEPKELIEARTRLGRFESMMSRPEGRPHLAEALQLLADVRDNPQTSDVAEVALTVALLYAKKVQAEVESLLVREPTIHWETVDHWVNTLSEFERYGFALPQEIEDSKAKLRLRRLMRDIAHLSPSERKELIERLQSMNTDSTS